MSGIIRELDVEYRFSPKVSRYDQFNAGLVATILICGFVVLSLLMVWLFGDQPQSRGVSPVLFNPIENVEDLAGLEQEQDEVVGGSDSTELVSLLESVENAVSDQAADSGSLGIGDSLPGIPSVREPNPFQTNSHSSRWKVSFQVEGVEQYKRQLDFFGIEIGVIDSRKDDIWRIGMLSSSATVTGSSREKERLSTWFAHSKPRLKRWDQQIAREAGIATEDRLFVQFYSVELVAKIMLLEADALAKQGRELDEVDTTHIRITQSGDQFSVSIAEFEFR